MNLLRMVLPYFLAIQILVSLCKLQIRLFGTHVKVYTAIGLIWRLQPVEYVHVIKSKVIFECHIVKLRALLVTQAQFARLIKLVNEFAL